MQNPANVTDWNAAFLAGMQGALRAYESILRQKSAAKYSFLDDLLAQRESGRLAATVQTLVRERCK
ncbi:MAG TPA: hypothetical protein VH350_16860 [Candidatus Sulfotelmatobacter sp.]|nr:hypothetical protein [Candidatus Sulfotelmatobacter sp.]